MFPKQPITIVLTLLMSGYGIAQELSQYRTALIGPAYLDSSASDIMSVSRHPAVLPRHTGLGFALQAEAGLVGPFHLAAASIVRAAGSVFALTIDYTGMPFYSQLEAGISYGRKLTDFLDLGISMRYRRTRAGYLSARPTFPFELGFSWVIKPGWLAGFRLYDPIELLKRPGQGGSSSYMFTVGLGSRITDFFHLALEAIQLNGLPVQPVVTLQYQAADFLNIRLQYRGSASVLGLSFIVGSGKTRYAFASSHYHYLSWVTGMGVELRAGKLPGP